MSHPEVKTWGGIEAHVSGSKWHGSAQGPGGSLEDWADTVGTSDSSPRKGR